MPRGDGTGPMGTGRMTGQGAGFAASGYANPIRLGCGFGGRRGFRRMFYLSGLPGWARFGHPAYAGANGAADERGALSRRVEFLEKQLQQVKRRLSHLKVDEE